MPIGSHGCANDGAICPDTVPPLGFGRGPAPALYQSRLGPAPALYQSRLRRFFPFGFSEPLSKAEGDLRATVVQDLLRSKDLQSRKLLASGLIEAGCRGSSPPAEVCPHGVDDPQAQNQLAKPTPLPYECR
jgi:hypothetical protein